MERQQSKGEPVCGDLQAQAKPPHVVIGAEPRKKQQDREQSKPVRQPASAEKHIREEKVHNAVEEDHDDQAAVPIIGRKEGTAATKEEKRRKEAERHGQSKLSKVVGHEGGKGQEQHGPAC